MIGAGVGGKLTVGSGVTGARVAVVGVCEGDNVGAVGFYVPGTDCWRINDHDDGYASKVNTHHRRIA